MVFLREIPKKFLHRKNGCDIIDISRVYVSAFTNFIIRYQKNGVQFDITSDCALF